MTTANAIENQKLEEIEKQQEPPNDQSQEQKKRQVKLEQAIDKFYKNYNCRFLGTLAINYTLVMIYLLLSIGVTIAGIEKPASHIEKPASHIEKPASHIEKPASHIEKPASHIEKPASHVKLGDFKYYGISLITFLGAALTLLYGIQTSLNIGGKITFYKKLAAESNNLLIELQTKPSTEENLEKILTKFQELQTREVKERPTDTIPAK